MTLQVFEKKEWIFTKKAQTGGPILYPHQLVQHLKARADVELLRTMHEQNQMAICFQGHVAIRVTRIA